MRIRAEHCVRSSRGRRKPLRTRLIAMLLLLLLPVRRARKEGENHGCLLCTCTTYYIILVHRSSNDGARRQPKGLPLDFRLRSGAEKGRQHQTNPSLAPDTKLSLAAAAFSNEFCAAADAGTRLCGLSVLGSLHPWPPQERAAVPCQRTRYGYKMLVLFLPTTCPPVPGSPYYVRSSSSASAFLSI